MATYFRTNPDGSAVYQKVGTETFQVADPARVSLRPGQALDDLTALQMGLWYILDQLKLVSVNRAKMMLTGEVVETRFRFDSIALDTPDTEDTQELSSPMLTIMARGETELQLAGPLSEQQLLEDTANLYGEGTILQKLYDSSVTLTIEAVFTNKDDRAAARKGIISALAREPLDERPGRRVIIKPYFDRLARYDLMGVTYEDSPDAAQSKLFPMVCRVAADIEVVDLVALPGYMKPSICIDNSPDAL